MPKKKDEEITIKQKTVFTFGHLHNAQNVAVALCSAGLLVRIVVKETENQVIVYEYA